MKMSDGSQTGFRLAFEAPVAAGLACEVATLRESLTSAKNKIS